MGKTLIEWVKNPDGSQGFTLNSKTGCLNGCPYCYARKLANGRLKPLYLANHEIATGSFQVSQGRPIEPYKDPFYPRFWPERLEEPYKIKKPAGIFLDDMSDWMGNYWPEEWTRQELQMMKDNPQHRIYTLTKQPQGLIKWSPFPDNCWVGVTATNEHQFVEAGYWLNQIEATVKYLSIEPFLERIPVEGFPLPSVFNWVIIGAMTFRGGINGIYPQLTPMPYGNRDTLQPKIEWVEEIVEAKDKAGIPVFFKNNLKPLFSIPEDEAPIHPEFGKARYKIPEWAYAKRGTDNWLRQEMPEE